MASKAENRVVNLAALVQGISIMVTFPAASSIFTNPTEYDLSNTQYGAMFLPQVLTAITTSLMGATLARRLTAKRVLLIGLTANITAMVVLVVTSSLENDPISYPLLLVATGFLGAGFGLTVNGNWSQQEMISQGASATASPSSASRGWAVRPSSHSPSASAKTRSPPCRRPSRAG